MNTRKRWVGLAVLTSLLAVIFSLPLADLLRYANSEELYSHIPLIPFIAGYLAWIHRRHIPAPTGDSILFGAILGVVGLVMGGAGMVALQQGWKPAVADQLAVVIGGFVVAFWGCAIGVLGWPTVKSMLFPMGFLIFLAPFPTVAMEQINWFFQHASAEMAYWMIKLPGTPVFRDGLMMQMPGVTVWVAEECSGIRSTLVLFLTSLMGGYMFLKRPAHRFWFAAAIVPLAIIRNGFRIFTISMLCVHIDPSMIHSWIHRKGGPVFFGLSLIPLFLLLGWMRRRENRK